MSQPFVLFEISWEVCNMVGGIHTVISTKAKTATAQFGDDYIAVGPWLLSESGREVPFDDEPGYEEFCETCRAVGVPVRVGRWRTPGRPRTILVEFSGLYDHRDDLLAELWEQFEVDSISGGWDYHEPVLFGRAAGIVIERWWEDFLAPHHRRAVVHAHEWMTGSSLLYVKPRLPSAGTVFTTHATMLGRALSSLGHSPSDGLGDKTPEGLAREHNVTAKHSIEGICAREADVFTTVSAITADEAELLHRRRPDPLLPNGIDLAVVDEVAGAEDRAAVRARLVEEAGRFLGEDVADATFLCVSGRYEFHNKGIDLLLDALARLEGASPRVVLFVLVPAGNSGLKGEVMDRRAHPLAAIDGPVGISTHNLFDEEHDPVHGRCRQLHLDNEPGSRVKVIQVPVYLGHSDGFLNLPYEAVLRAMDLSCFPSYYEPWGYTPQESLAVGVPTITTDYAGFGRWAQAEGLGVESGILVLPRVHRNYDEVVGALAGAIEEFLGAAPGTGLRASVATCRATAARTAWSDLFDNYRAAYDAALERVQGRAVAGAVQHRRPKRALAVLGRPAADPRLTTFEVTAALPSELSGLERLARNFWWSWDHSAPALFEDLDPALWAACRHNPVALLQRVAPARLAARAADASYQARVERTLARLEAYLAEGRRGWVPDAVGADGVALGHEHGVAYFSAEFGVHESLPIYSGGLGVLAGDHLKSASDLGLPLTGIGLFYRMGYLQQHLTATGEQIEVDRENDPHTLALERVRTPEGAALEIEIQLPGRKLHLGAWRARVGAVSLYLLDADRPANRAEDRDITRNLYGGDHEMRILQEIALGRGGARLLRRLGVRPAVYHMNEGHAAFLTLERVSRLMGEEGLTFDAAREIVRATTAFTTHTPVPAGHDRFSEELVRRYFSDAEQWCGVPWERFFELGRDGDEFNMTHLAMSFASWMNGVSKLHQVASRQLLKPFWPGRFEDEVPVHTVTNGIHLPSWTHPDIVAALGGKDDTPVTGARMAELATTADPAAVWQARVARKAALVERATAALQDSFIARSDSPLTLHRILEGLDPDALLIGFARRFAPYKRAQLLFQDVARLESILADTERPVRVLVAGKAHPRDQHGKDVLRDIAARTRHPELLGRVVFLEDYDIDLARVLVQGVDVWLNNPTRMLEASGTSGMKAAANGALNLSIGDGWWPEAADGRNGWTIAGGRMYEDQALQDQFDAASLYRLLEEEIVPLYFDRDADGVPRGWVERILANFATIPPVFNTDRMVREYVAGCYEPLAQNYVRYVADRKALPKELARTAQRIRRGFPTVKVVAADIADLDAIRVGEEIGVRLELDPGELAPEDLAVEFVVGSAVAGGLQNVRCVPLAAVGGPSAEGVYRFEGTYRVDGTGLFAHGLRIRARRAGDTGGTLDDLVSWA